jgi:hypothetical protein
MKTKLAVILALACLSSARATLIDLTPGGFSTEMPKPYFAFISQINRGLTFFDSMKSTPYNIFGVDYPAGWISQFGILDGGVYFFAHIDESGPVPQTTISWDMTNSGYYLSFVTVEGNGWGHLYRVPRAKLIGEGSVTLNGIVPINQIAFYGRGIHWVPDTGSTLGLFALGVGALAFLRKK